MVVEVVLFLVGLAMLYYGAEWVVCGSSSIALKLGITPLIVGCTVVAFGTSAPEFVVSMAAVIDESDGISVGTIIGSNIANLALILGVSSMIRPIEVSNSVVFREYPVMAATLGLLIVLASDGFLTRVDGGIFLSGMVLYTIYMIKMARDEMKRGQAPDVMADVDDEGTDDPYWKNVAKVVAGILGLAVGAKLMVDSAVTIASALEVDEMIIGISIVAIGTSLPELATSVVAGLKGEADISVGNVVGSNVFNTLLVLGAVASISEIAIGERAVEFDLWAMGGVTVAVWCVMFTRRTISKLEGFVLVTMYVSYIGWIFMG